MFFAVRRWSPRHAWHVPPRGGHAAALHRPPAAKGGTGLAGANKIGEQHLGSRNTHMARLKVGVSILL